MRQFISHRLIDEFRLFVHPINLGEGVPLFPHHSERTNRTFDGSQSFSSGLVELRLRPEPGTFRAYGGKTGDAVLREGRSQRRPGR
ncbi:MAG: dihydrofolate reductase family protein [Pirellulaceae bacterium]|nr:dihydrofolate reductase family protein [Pirellulaceae bacterium]